jgi:peroxiredoxin
LPVTLADYRGDHTLLFFWNPGCKFCQRMLDQLRAWEDDPRRSAQLLFISTGSVEENRAQGLRSTILLEEKFETGKRYGVAMTPSAILIDADGRIASLLEIGAENILALTGAPRPAAV